MSRRGQFDPVWVPGQNRSGGGTITLRLLVVLVVVFGAGLAIALVTA
jgi:hypothetical protein